MDGRTSVALLTFALSLSVSGCITTTQSQKSVDVIPGKSDETAVASAKNDGPKHLPQAKTEIAFGKLKEIDAESEAARSSPELQARLRDDARRAYQKALEIDKNNLEAFRGLAGVYVKSDNYDRAFDVYKKAIEKHPKVAVLWYELALAHQRRKDFPESIRCLNKALEMEPENRDYMKKLGFTLAWMGQVDQGFTYLMRAQGKALAHCNIARVLIERDQMPLARQHLTLAHQENPELPEANALLAWLDSGSRGAQPQ